MKLMAVSAVLLVGASPVGWALGFRNPDQGARATGQGEAFVAQADDASAIYYNPAGLTQLQGTQVSFGGMASFRDIKFNGPFGSAKLDDPAYTGHFYVSSDLLLPEKWCVGLGVNTPFGNSMDWGDTGPFTYLSTKSSLMVLNIQPTVAYQINEHLSVGVGLNVYYGDTKLERQVSFFPFPVPDGHFKFNGDGVAVGGTVGALWKINEQHSVGAVYRSPFTIKFDGDAEVTSAPPIPGLDYSKADANAKIDFPQSVALGYAFRPIKKLKLEVDVEWTDWDSLNSVELRSANSLDGTTVPYDWQSSFWYAAGIQYELTDNLAVRVGYIYSQNSVPDATYSPTLPDADRHVVSAGVGYTTSRFSVDLVYQFSISPDRTVTGSYPGTPLAGNTDGTWASQAHAIMISGNINF
jgi:long-chain fatty acid transport protein